MSLIFNLFNQLNWFLGIKIFKNANYFTINLYRYFYKKNICNLNILKSKFINNFFSNGFTRLKSIDKKTIEKINNELSLQPVEVNNPRMNNQKNFKITPEIFNLVKKILDYDLNDELKLIEQYYNQKLILAHLTISRNYETPINFEEKDYHVSKEKEPYSNFYHTDGYVYNMFKLFINLQDVSENQGPMHLVMKEKAKKFIKNKKYYSRESYLRTEDSDKEVEDCIYRNTGKIGDVLMCSTTELIHKAGDVGKGQKRDILFLDFVAKTSDKSQKNMYFYGEEIFKHDVVKRLSKIAGIKNLIKYYFDGKKYSLN